jgi:hypothetical protein
MGVGNKKKKPRHEVKGCTLGMEKAYAKGSGTLAFDSLGLEEWECVKMEVKGREWQGTGWPLSLAPMEETPGMYTCSWGMTASSISPNSSSLRKLEMDGEGGQSGLYFSYQPSQVKHPSWKNTTN